ncbi:EthD domain-containing protein [Amycolatopsis nivea]
MIHQLIFAAPKPGMCEQEFQDYWLDVHAVEFASKIPQIRKYLIDKRIPFPGEDPDAEPLWSGVAEIWLENEQEQLASLQTDEFLQGARLDEPNWAAFWRTVVLDTDAHVVREGAEPAGVKMIMLAKRREGLPLKEFREHSLGEQASLMAEVPGLRRYLQGFTKDGYYSLGEALLDVAYQLYFDDVSAVSAALESPEFARATKHLESIAEPRYVHRLLFTEHWVIGPQAR